MTKRHFVTSSHFVLGGVAALAMAGAGVFWWAGRAEMDRRTPPAVASPPSADSPIDLPSGDPDARGGALPTAVKKTVSPEERRFNRYDRNRDGRITRNEMLSTRVKAFQKLDTNHDNLLSFEEWAVKTSNRFKEVDRNGDGVIGRDELAAYYAEQDRKKAERAKARASACACAPGGRAGAPGKGAPSEDDED